MASGAVAWAAMGLVVAGAGLAAAAPGSGGAPGMAAMGAAIAEAHARLLAQCPAVAVPADAASLPVHITRWGDKGPAVLLVHGGVQGGIGGGPSNFAGQKPLADEGFQLRLIDRPGFGQSPSRGPDDQTADAALIAAALGHGSHLVGHSFGGAEALLAAGQRPEAVRSLILIEPALQTLAATDPASLADPGVRDSLQHVVRAMLGAKTPADFATTFAGDLGTAADGGPNPSAAALKAHPERAPALGCALVRARIATPPALRQAADAVVAAGIPVLVVSGGYSAGQDASAAAVARILHGRHLVVRSPNHFIQQSNAAGFNEAAAAFMRAADARHGR